MEVNELVSHRHSSATLLLRPRLPLTNVRLASMIESHQAEPNIEHMRQTAALWSSRICVASERE